MSEILNTLYREYNDLNDKLQKIKDLIVIYGGAIPGLESQQNPTGYVGAGVIGAPDYPREATLRDKLIYVIKWFDKPVAIAEIYDKLITFEPSLRATSKNLRSTIGQYCSAMRDKELIVDTTEFRHRYSYNPKQ